MKTRDKPNENQLGVLRHIKSLLVQRGWKELPRQHWDFNVTVLKALVRKDMVKMMSHNMLAITEYGDELIAEAVRDELPV